MNSVDEETANGILIGIRVDEEEDLAELENEEGETETFSVDIQAEDDELVSPEGGWGWVVLAAAFLTMGLNLVPLFCYGILYSTMFQENKVSAASIAWIFNVQFFIWNCSVLMVGPFCDEFGWRTVSVVGGIFNSLTLILSGLIPRYEYLFFTYSTLGGIGGSIGISVPFFVVSKYFEKRRGFALGITSLGSCGAAFISPLISNYLLMQYGFQGASLIMGAILLHQSVAGTLFHPVEWHMKQRPIETLNDVKENLEISDKKSEFEIIKRKSVKLLNKTSECSQISADLEAINGQKQTISKIKITNSNYKTNPFIKVFISTYSNLKSLRSTRVILIALSSGGMMMGYINFQMWIPFSMRDDGHSLDVSAYALSVGAISNTCGRAVAAILADWSKFDVTYAYMASLLVISASIVAFSLFANLYYIYVCVAVWSYSVGMAMSLQAPVMIKTMGVEKFPAVFGISSLFIAFTFVAVGPITGMGRDTTSNFKVSFWVIAGIVFISFLFWLVMPFAKKYDVGREQSGKKDQL